jgi:hypothetical protein
VPQAAKVHVLNGALASTWHYQGIIAILPWALEQANSAQRRIEIAARTQVDAANGSSLIKP